MTKIQVRTYLEEKDVQFLKQKALESKFEGRGWLSRLLHKIANSDIIYIDDNLNKFSKMLNVKIK